MKHVMIVAFHFPPESSSSGVLRTAKFARYLADYGWRVTVLTVDTSAYSATDDALLAGMPSTVRIIRTRFLELRRIFSIRGRFPSLLIVPDGWLGWMPYAVKAGLAASAQDRPDVIFSTSPYPTAHLIAQFIARRLHIPSVTDFRDPWYEDPPEPGTPALVQWAARRLERRVITRASRVVASTTALRDHMRQQYPHLASEKFTAVANGYDEADFAELKVSEREPSAQLVMLHAGSINGDFRDPRPLFESLGAMIRAGEIGAARFRIQFAGAGAYAESAQIAESLRTNGLEDVVQFLPRVKYAESLALMAKADVLLLLQASQDTTSLVPAKIYEYMRARRPVLALVLPGATPDVIEQTRGGWSCDPADATTLRASLRNILERWRSGALRNDYAAPEALARFDRRALTGELSQILQAATGSPAS